jgi:hypothetical protein
MGMSSIEIPFVIIYSTERGAINRHEDNSAFWPLAVILAHLPQINTQIVLCQSLVVLSKRHPSIFS